MRQVALAKRGKGSLRAVAKRQSCGPPWPAPSTASAMTLPSPVSVSSTVERSDSRQVRPRWSSACASLRGVGRDGSLGSDVSTSA